MRHVLRARDVAGAQARPRLGRLAAEAVGGAGVDDLGVAELGRGRDLGDVAHQPGVRGGR